MLSQKFTPKVMVHNIRTLDPPKEGKYAGQYTLVFDVLMMLGDFGEILHICDLRYQCGRFKGPVVPAFKSGYYRRRVTFSIPLAKMIADEFLKTAEKESISLPSTPDPDPYAQIAGLLVSPNSVKAAYEVFTRKVYSPQD